MITIADGMSFSRWLLAKIRLFCCNVSHIAAVRPQIKKWTWNERRVEKEQRRRQWSQDKHMEQCQAQRRDQVETPREVPIHKQQLIKYVIIVRFLFISFTCHAMASSRCLISSPQTRRPRPRRLCLSLVPLRLLAAVYEQQKVLLSDNPTTIQIICKRRFGDPHYSFRKCPVFSLVFHWTSPTFKIQKYFKSHSNRESSTKLAQILNAPRTEKNSA